MYDKAITGSLVAYLAMRDQSTQDDAQRPQDQDDTAAILDHLDRSPLDCACSD
jgi:hypothetical protein